MGFGTAFILVDNVKKVLSELGVSASVDQAAFNIAGPTNADLYITHTEFAEKLKQAGKTVIVLKSVVDMNEIRKKLKDYFNKKKGKE